MQRTKLAQCLLLVWSIAISKQDNEFRYSGKIIVRAELTKAMHQNIYIAMQ